jgi:uncharacterized membrane protein YsdA (DUF1294 family)
MSCLCDHFPPLVAYVVTCLAAPGLLAIALSIIDRRAAIKRMHRMRSHVAE